MADLAHSHERARRNARLGVATLLGHVGHTHPQRISLDCRACGGSDA